jgi:hypothetical protein
MKGCGEKEKKKKKKKKAGKSVRNGVGERNERQQTCDRPNCRAGEEPSEQNSSRANQMDAEPLVGSINDQLQIVVADGAVVAAGKLWSLSG